MIPVFKIFKLVPPVKGITAPAVNKNNVLGIVFSCFQVADLNSLYLCVFFWSVIIWRIPYLSRFMKAGTAGKKRKNQEPKK